MVGCNNAPSETDAPDALTSGSSSTPSEEVVTMNPPSASPTSPAEPPKETEAPTPAAPQLDSDGVVMMFPPNTKGSSWSLGTSDPNLKNDYFDINGAKATEETENGITYWANSGGVVNYRSGKPSGRTVRLNIRASGGSQKYTWKNGAIENGYLGKPNDLKNLEATAYVRVRGNNGTHTSMNWKLRGGRHSSSDESLSSCVELGVPYGDEAPEAGRELDHPYYDMVPLTPKFPYSVEEGRWVGVKVVSYVIDGGTKNLLYLDTDPFDANGKPRNEFRLYTEWEDLDGVNTGRYSTAATWAGHVTTFRVDGWKFVDFAILSAREIIPPAA